MAPQFNLSSEKLLVILVARLGGFEPTYSSDPKHCLHESYTLSTELYRLISDFRLVQTKRVGRQQLKI